MESDARQMEGDSLIALLRDNDAVHHAKVGNDFISILLPNCFGVLGWKETEVMYRVGWGGGGGNGRRYPHLAWVQQRHAAP